MDFDLFKTTKHINEEMLKYIIYLHINTEILIILLKKPAIHLDINQSSVFITAARRFCAGAKNLQFAVQTEAEKTRRVKL